MKWIHFRNCSRGTTATKKLAKNFFRHFRQWKEVLLRPEAEGFSLILIEEAGIMCWKAFDPAGKVYDFEVLVREDKVEA